MLQQPSTVLTGATDPACVWFFTQDPARAQYLVREALEPFMSLGGVRIESNVLVTADGRCGSWTAAHRVQRASMRCLSRLAGAGWKALGAEALLSESTLVCEVAASSIVGEVAVSSCWGGCQ
jgi:hypothetical protein